MPVTPERRPNSIRLTTHVDVHTEPSGQLVIQARARELRTASNSTDELAKASITARIGKGRALSEIQAIPDDGRTQRLVGEVVGSGFRATVRRILGEGASEDALQLLLDDLPAAALISGYAALYSGEMNIAPKHLEMGLLKPNICSGWREDATMLVTLKERGQLPVPMGPTVNVLERPGDTLGWHELEPLAQGAMRRRRLIDLSRDDGSESRIFAMFRDTHVDRDGVESILHEYTLSADLDRSTGVISNCVAEPRVLPWGECPAAASSAARVNGCRLDELSAFVARELRGTSTCTHLNDLLRSLANVAMLLEREQS